MDPISIITMATAGIKLATEAIDAASTGDVETAQQKLDAARDHFSASVEAWEAARKEQPPTSTA